MIKYSYIILFVIMTALLISCGDDDDNSTSPEQTGEIDDALVGTWVLTNILSPIATTPEAAGIALTALFNDDGSMQLTTIDSEGTSIAAGTWFTSNGGITITLEGGEPGTSTYTVEGNKATLTNFPVEFQGTTILATLEFTKIP
jgi:hypothetical protein